MDNKEEIPKANAPSKGKKILVYAAGGFVLLALLTIILPSGEDATTSDKCVDHEEFAVWLDNAMMQTGYFKTANSLVHGTTLELKVEPSSDGYNDPDSFKKAVYLAVSKTPVCVGIKDVEVTLIGAEYNTLLGYPFSAALNGTEDRDMTKTIKQR